LSAANAAADTGFGAISSCVVGQPPAEFFSRGSTALYSPCSVISIENVAVCIFEARADLCLSNDVLNVDDERRVDEASQLDTYWKSAIATARQLGMRPNRARHRTDAEEPVVVYPR
jgi:hypothetical protein